MRVIILLIIDCEKKYGHKRLFYRKPVILDYFPQDFSKTLDYNEDKHGGRAHVREIKSYHTALPTIVFLRHIRTIL